MSRELLRQALDALVHCAAGSIKTLEMKNAAATAIRAELAKPEPEPVAWGVFHADGRAHIYQQREAAEVFGDAVPLVIPQQAQPAENPWKDAVLDRLASASIDAPTDEFPSRILDRIIEVEAMIAKELTPAPAVPDGWVMVPRNPAQASIGAGVVALYEASKKDFEASGSEVAAVYRAMIAAAPGSKP